ncbi:MAG: DNA repair protein RecN [Flavobacteriaceae bacterium]|nr:DNA repair protein RecN [Flavobacteriaceae bacterium]
MLTQLTIKNFALIEELEASFSSGMTCITGETGAGKSILLGGLSLVLGKRADLSSLLNPNKKCIVEASFQIEAYALETLFENLDVDYESQTILRREILPQGKSRAFINDTPVTLNVLEQISLHLIDLHSQNDTSSLLRNEYQFKVLDALANNKALLSKYEVAHSEYKLTQKQYQEVTQEYEKAKASHELDDFLYQELLKLNLQEGMHENLESKHSALIHVDYLQSTLAEAVQLMENESTGILDQLLKLRGLASGLEQKSSRFTTLQERFTSMFIEAEDLLAECKLQLENLETNPEELEKLQFKLDLLNRQMQKHKVNSVSDLIKIEKQLAERLKKTLNVSSQLDELKKTEKKLEKLLHSLVKKLTQSRKGAVQILEKELSGLVSKMGMKEAFFKIELFPADTFLSNGSDQLDFQFKSNKGSDFKPLKKIVSGGELSRIMLAIKSILSHYVKLPTLIFDEIDTGVSGKISDSIAEVMVSMGQRLQLINITHLPQVAAKGDYHFKVMKREQNGRTLTELFSLNKEARIDEIAMMLSGNQVTPTAIAHAKQLMN